MTFKIYRDDKFLAEFEDEFIEDFITPSLDVQYVSGSYHPEKRQMTIWIEFKKAKEKEKEKRITDYGV